MPINPTDHPPGTLIECDPGMTQYNGDRLFDGVAVVHSWAHHDRVIVAHPSVHFASGWFTDWFRAVVADHPRYSAEHAAPVDLDPAVHGPGTLVRLTNRNGHEPIWLSPVPAVIEGWDGQWLVKVSHPTLTSGGLTFSRERFEVVPYTEPVAEPEPEPEPEGWECADCNAHQDVEQEHENTDGCPICDGCAEEYGNCDHCGCRQHNDHSHWSEVHEANFCESCYNDRVTSCDSCSEEMRSQDAVEHGGHDYCQSCYDDNHFRCDECGRSYHNDDRGDSEDDILCTSCAEARSEGTMGIRGYSDKTANRLGPFGKGPVYYGVELEVEAVNGATPSEGAAVALDRMGTDFAVCKGDGSLRNGFEIVTAPADVATHAERWTACLRRKIPGMRSWKTDTCGMHVHVSRRPLSQLTIGKLLVFVNAYENETFMRSLAGRGSNTYARVCPKKATDARHSSVNRYEAINLCNRETIEFRIFKGTLLLSSVLKNIEFCAALIEYCKGTAGLGDLRWEAFCSWVERTPRVWPNLSAWLREHGFMRKPKARGQGWSSATEVQQEV